MTEIQSALATWAQELASQYSASLRESAAGEPEFSVDCQTNSQAAHSLLCDLQKRGYIHLADLTAYDETAKPARFHVVYELISLKEKKRCSVIAIVKNEKPSIVTVADLWKGANWLEREVYDMYGIQFEGHPDPRRILLPPSFVGYPLRKDFVVDYRQDYEKSNIEEGSFDPFGSTIVKAILKTPHPTAGENT